MRAGQLNAKSAQIREIARQLNLGVDSFVFVDDNPVELAEVAAELPSVACLQFPSKDDGLPELFRDLARLFAKPFVTVEDRERTQLYRIVEFIGRWSMLDVFVDTFTVALVQLSPLMSVAPAPGLFFFAAVVVLTMLAVESFDPRLIWDPANSREVRHA